MSAKGGSFAFFGPFILDVGCTEYSFIHFDDESFVNTGNLKYVGDEPEGVYTLIPPKSNVNYCNVQKNEVVEVDGSNAHSKIINCLS